MLFCHTIQRFLCFVQNDVLERVNSLVEKIEQFEPEVQLLVCDSLADDDNTATLTTLTGEWNLCSKGAFRILFAYQMSYMIFKFSFGSGREREGFAGITVVEKKKKRNNSPT